MAFEIALVELGHVLGFPDQTDRLNLNQGCISTTDLYAIIQLTANPTNTTETITLPASIPYLIYDAHSFVNVYTQMKPSQWNNILSSALVPCSGVAFQNDYAAS
jgi:hypothetical protein